ncbi:MAG: hypothetical protein K2Y23_16905 [Cyanobacteria bacterium]|nr:hypothetical protein [Cyanobacteriota bacterium]
MTVPFGAGAHDFWLVPDAFRLTPTDDMAVRGQTSSAFPASEAVSGDPALVPVQARLRLGV